MSSKKKPARPTATSIDRNDIAGAVAVAEAAMDDGSWSSDLAGILLKLQDTPDAYGKAFGAMVRRRRRAGLPTY